MVRNFTWLKLVSYANFVVLSLYFVIILSRLFAGTDQFTWWNCFDFLVLFFLAGHTILTLRLYRECYPDKIITAGIKLWFLLFEAFAPGATFILSCIFLYLILTMTAVKTGASIQVLDVIISLMAVLAILQLAGARLFVNIVRKNVERKQKSTLLNL